MEYKIIELESKGENDFDIKSHQTENKIIKKKGENDSYRGPHTIENEIQTKLENDPHEESLPKNADNLEKGKIEKEISNFDENISTNREKKKINTKLNTPLIVISIIVPAVSALIYFTNFTKKVSDIFMDNNHLIENNNVINIGVLELINEDKNGKIRIRKELLKNKKYFIACLGGPGSGKSTFASNFYKKLYKVKNDYFEISHSGVSYTKGIWLISEEERRKIPKYITKDILDVEGFQIDHKRSWNYAIVIAFLSTDLVILNKDVRYDEIGKILRIIQKGFEEMRRMNITRILKNIYIQTIYKEDENSPIEELLKSIEKDKKFKYDMTLFQGIKLKYIYLPHINKKSKTEKELMKYPEYKNQFEKILDTLNEENNCSSVTSLLDHIDKFNEVINGNTFFDSQDFVKEMEDNFNSIYA